MKSRTVGLWLGLYVAMAAAVDAIAAAGPLFRFIQVNDTHISYDDKDTYMGTRGKFDAVIRAVTRRSANRVDFVVSPGDNAHGDKREKLAPDNEAAAEMLLRFEIPVMVTPGNHEVLQGEGVPELQAGYLKTFGADTTTYGVVYGGILFVMVDDSGGKAGGDAVSDARNRKVDEILSRFPDLPKIISCHIPLVPMRDPVALAKSFASVTWKIVGDGGLLDVIEKHRDTVIAVLAGHLHLTSHVVQNGIHHITASGTASYPNDYGEFEVYEDRIEVRMTTSPFAGRAPFGSDVHNRTGVAYTDAQHPTHEQYVSGLPDERAFSIPLTGRKRPSYLRSLLALNPEGWVCPSTAVRLDNFGRLQVDNWSDRPRELRVPITGLVGDRFTITDADGRAIAASTGGAEWSQAALRAGLPLTVPAGGTVSVEIKSNRSR